MTTEKSPQEKPRKKSLVIVESPAKARTIAGFLGNGFIVESSIGHIRDLPKRASDIPPSLKKAPWARLGVDVDHGFKPLYIVDADKKAQISKLKQHLSQADELFLATDEDREGESIAWHLLEVLKPKVPVKRMVFHEITRPAIEKAINEPREVDRRLVDAQEARRILDRLYGYEVSPVLWKKVMPKLSAGRVQSVATRIIVERENARIRFNPAGYWSIDGLLQKSGGEGEIPASVVSVDGTRIATGKDFGEDGQLLKPDVLRMTEEIATSLTDELRQSRFTVKSVERKPSRRQPAPPFMTSTLQQEAGRKLRMSAARAMKVAQSLYEGGFITYMRTDSTTLSDSAVQSARKQIERLYGASYLPERPRVYAKKVKNAQEAHEAIRPAGDVFRTPDEVARLVTGDEARLYELVWMRTIASQMQDARIESVSIRVAAACPGGRAVELAASGNTITFPGFLRAYVEGSDDPSAELENRERPLPPVVEGEHLLPSTLEPKEHVTQPPARFTEASLVRRLEELGVGRPSTYASIISTILDRGYIWKKGTALVPSFKAFAVVALLEQHFGELVDYAFTARMEDELDAIAQGVEQLEPWLHRFYFGGNGDRTNVAMAQGLRTLVADQLGEIDARAINSRSLGQDESGQDVVVRVGRYGPYLQRDEDTVSIPEDLPPDELTLSRAIEFLAAPSGDRVLGADPETGLPVIVRQGRFGTYVQLGEAGEGKERPKTASILKSMSADTLTLDEALKVLSLPREVGVDPSDGKVITAQLGRYGPYIAKGTDSRSLEREEQIFTVTVEEALAIFSQPRRRARRAAAEPLRELGTDGVSGKTITLREGRFGFYVTDGETNASLRRGDTPEGIDNARAQELLQVRRERGPATKAPKRGARKAASKPGAKPAKKRTAKAAAKKSPSKSTSDGPASAAPAKKATAKKATAKKAKKATARKATAKKAPAKKGAKKDGSSEATTKKPVARPAATTEDSPG